MYQIDFDDGEVILENVYTPEQSRRKGAGKKLVQALQQKAHDLDLPVTGYLYPQDDTVTRDELVEFYESLGFEIDGYDFIRSEYNATGVYAQKVDKSPQMGVSDGVRFSMRADETWKEMADKLATRIMPVIRDHTATISLAEEIKTLLLEEGFLLEDAEVNEIIAKAKDMLRGWQARMRARQDLAYIYETDPWLNAIAAVYGDNFRIVPGEKYRGEEFDGTWINNKKKWHLQGESNPC